MDASVENKLQALYHLQLIDTELDRIKNIRGELPMEVSDLEDTIEGLQTRVEKLQNDINDLTKTIEDRKSGIKESKNLIQKYEEQQNDVKNNREFLALTKEVELQKLEIMASEKKIKEHQQDIEAKELLLTKTKSELEDRSRELEGKKGELGSIIEDTEKETSSLIAKREKALAAIDDRLEAAYVRIRSNVVNGQAVVTIEREACGGCFSQIPPQRQLDIRQRKKIIVCENCGRIFVDKDMAIEVADDVKA
ncbi:MAG: C4-type zinc ribbon domain-containing protein [Bacteroidia bacterium]